MLQLRTMVALFACCTAVGFTQDRVATQSQGQPTRPRMIRVAGKVMAAFVDHRTLPVYPDEAMTKEIQGDVIFKIDVDETGKIILSVPIEGDPLLVAASMDALRDYRFHP